jgi:hypothetical protein
MLCSTDSLHRDINARVSLRIQSPIPRQDVSVNSRDMARTEEYLETQRPTGGVVSPRRWWEINNPYSSLKSPDAIGSGGAGQRDVRTAI